VKKDATLKRMKKEDSDPWPHTSVLVAVVVYILQYLLFAGQWLARSTSIGRHYCRYTHAQPTTVVYAPFYPPEQLSGINTSQALPISYRQPRERPFISNLIYSQPNDILPDWLFMDGRHVGVSRNVNRIPSQRSRTCIHTTSRC
jgi:hypothetical protein